MKSILIFLIVAFNCSFLKAQDHPRHKRIAGGVEFRYLDAVGVHVDKLGSQSAAHIYGKSFRLCLGYFIFPKLYTGISFGADRYEEPGGVGSSIKYFYVRNGANTFPLCLSSRYYFKDSKNTFFVFGEAGPNIILIESSDKGCTGTIGVGYKFNMFKKTSFSALLGYNSERTNYSNVTEDDAAFVSRQSVLIGLGINF